MNARKKLSAKDIPTPQGVSRRSFLKFCSAVAITIGLGPTGMVSVARALTGPKPIVVWLNFSECTGCSESLLRMSSPTPDSLILDTISLEYHETLMAAAGLAATNHLSEVVDANAGNFFAVVEGSIPTANNGAYGTIGGETMLSIAQRVLPKAKAVIAYGTCSSYGGLAAAAPNPTGAKGVKDLGILGSVPCVNVSGCPPNPYNLAGVITTYLLNGTIPPLDSNGRPTFAYGKTVHSACPRPHGCLEDYGCRGKSCYNNCPSVKFNGGTSWDIQAVHHCIGCSQPRFWDTNAPFYPSEFSKKFAESNHSSIK